MQENEDEEEGKGKWEAYVWGIPWVWFIEAWMSDCYCSLTCNYLGPEFLHVTLSYLYSVAQMIWKGSHGQSKIPALFSLFLVLVQAQFQRFRDNYILKRDELAGKTQNNNERTGASSRRRSAGASASKKQLIFNEIPAFLNLHWAASYLVTV